MRLSARPQSLCFNHAVEQGIAHAQLPIGDVLKMSSRKVLTINQGTHPASAPPCWPTCPPPSSCPAASSAPASKVLEILVRFRETGSWKEAIEPTMPQRKHFELITPAAAPLGSADPS